MARKSYATEEIIKHLRTMEIEKSMLRIGMEMPKKLYFPEHHESHAASAFFPSPYESAAVLTVDGVGEWATTTLGRGEGNRLDLLKEIRFPHSLGLLYSAFTYFCGFKVNSGEYKLMGLAPYGRPVYADLIRKHLLDLRDDGSFRLDMRYFDYLSGLRMTNRRFADLFGGPPRKPEVGKLPCARVPPGRLPWPNGASAWRLNCRLSITVRASLTKFANACSIRWCLAAREGAGSV